MGQEIETVNVDKTTPRTAPASGKMPFLIRDPRGILILAILAAFVVLAVGGYAFNWAWTGFKGNTLWDWLHLLILPVVLTTMTLWLLQHHKWQPSWTITLVVIGIIFIILAIGGYVFNWSWTGFKGNTLWDWLQLLILPVVLTVVTAWYSIGSESTKVGVNLNEQLIRRDLQEANIRQE